MEGWSEGLPLAARRTGVPGVEYQTEPKWACHRERELMSGEGVTGKGGPVHGGELPGVGAGGESDGPGLEGVKDRDVAEGELGLQLFARGMGGRVVDNDDPRLDGVEECSAERAVGVVGGTDPSGDEEVGMEVVGAGKEGKLAGSAEVGEQQDADALDVAEQNDGVIVGASGGRGWVGVKDGPRAEMVAGLESGLPRKIGADKIGEGAVIGRAGNDGIEENNVGPEFLNEILRAADVVDVAVSKNEVGEAVDAVGVEVRGGDGFNGGFVAAVNEPIVEGMVGLKISAASVFKRQDGKARDGTLIKPEPAPDETEGDKGGNFPDSISAFEEPASEQREKSQVIEADGEKAGHGDVEIGGGPVSGPSAGNADAFHEEPAGVIEDNCEERKPRAEKKAGKVADKNESTERNGNDIGGSAARRKDVEIPGDERDRAEPRGEGG